MIPAAASLVRNDIVSELTFMYGQAIGLESLLGTLFSDSPSIILSSILSDFIIIYYYQLNLDFSANNKCANLFIVK